LKGSGFLARGGGTGIAENELSSQEVGGIDAILRKKKEGHRISTRLNHYQGEARETESGKKGVHKHRWGEARYVF